MNKSFKNSMLSTDIDSQTNEDFSLRRRKMPEALRKILSQTEINICEDTLNSKLIKTFKNKDEEKF